MLLLLLSLSLLIYQDKVNPSLSKPVTITSQVNNKDARPLIYPPNLGVMYHAFEGSVWNDKTVSLLWSFNVIGYIIRSTPFLFML